MFEEAGFGDCWVLETRPINKPDAVDLDQMYNYTSFLLSILTPDIQVWISMYGLTQSMCGTR